MFHIAKLTEKRLVFFSLNRNKINEVIKVDTLAFFTHNIFNPKYQMSFTFNTCSSKSNQIERQKKRSNK